MFVCIGLCVLYLFKYENAPVNILVTQINIIQQTSGNRAQGARLAPDEMGVCMAAIAPCAANAFFFMREQA